MVWSITMPTGMREFNPTEIPTSIPKTTAALQRKGEGSIQLEHGFTNRESPSMINQKLT